MLLVSVLQLRTSPELPLRIQIEEERNPSDKKKQNGELFVREEVSNCAPYASLTTPILLMRRALRRKRI